MERKKMHQKDPRWSMTVYFKSGKEYLDVLSEKPVMVNKSVWLRNLILETLNLKDEGGKK